MPSLIRRFRRQLRNSSLTPEQVTRPAVPGAPQHAGDRLVPRVVAGPAGTVARCARTVARTADVASSGRVARLTLQAALGMQSLRADPTHVVPVRLREGSTVWLRPRSHDVSALEFVFEDHHLPPADLTGPVRRIAVLGANIGLLLADLGDRYPDARLLAVEPDPGNAAVARRNLQRFAGRAEVVEAAAAIDDGTLTLSWGHDAWGLLQNADDEAAPAESITVPARDTAALLRRFADDEPVDYVLVNIEDAWYDLLADRDWTRNVRAITIEIQDHYDEAVPLLESHGFRARLEPLEWGAFLIGVRP
ncbi:hypothetical protein GCM10009836_60580 [Pseudonocardia ailaonensis]|uniref:FkbM family methyltransferase n=1 Tax=Pseudonocardia ailaonensis TaxID=367279 RepID=A0ABN2NKR9_9PSEU